MMRTKIATAIATAFVVAATLAPVVQAADAAYPPEPCPVQPIVQWRNGQLYLVIPVPGPGCNHLVVPVPTNMQAPPPPL
jgi:hypothetical protein